MRPSISRVSLPSASGVPTPVGQKNAPMPAPAGAHSLGEIALWDDLEFDLARAVQRVEDIRVGLSWEGADHFPDPTGLQQGGQPDLTVARVVRDDGQILRALADEPVDVDCSAADSVIAVGAVLVAAGVASFRVRNSVTGGAMPRD